MAKSTASNTLEAASDAAFAEATGTEPPDVTDVNGQPPTSDPNSRPAAQPGDSVGFGKRRWRVAVKADVQPGARLTDNNSIIVRADDESGISREYNEGRKGKLKVFDQLRCDEIDASGKVIPPAPPAPPANPAK